MDEPFTIPESKPDALKCCGTCRHWQNQETPMTYRRRHCHLSGYYGGDIKNDSTTDCEWEPVEIMDTNYMAHEKRTA